jgi:hypothetical protein
MSEHSTAFTVWAAKQRGWDKSKTSLKTSIFDINLDLFPSLCWSGKTGDEQPLPVRSEGVSTRGLMCMACRLTFLDVREQQAHFKTDAHVKTLRNKVSGKEFTAAELSTNDEDPQSEDSDHSSTEEEPDTDALPADQNVPTELRSTLGSLQRQPSAQQGPTFHIRDNAVPSVVMVVGGGIIPSNSVLSGRSWALVESEAEKENVLVTLGDHLRQVQSAPLVAVFLLRSGRFSGAVFSGNTLLIHKVRSSVFNSVQWCVI